MASTIEHPHDIDKATQPDPDEKKNAVLVREELDRILESKFFKNSPRSRQFLEYVVRHKLDGHAEQLKERTIGIAVFQRAPGYATGDDPIVRVQASDVRRRLEQYYRALPDPPSVRIELHAGSYSPNIHWSSAVCETSTDHPPEPLPAQTPQRRIRAIPFLLAGLILALVAGTGWIFAHSRANPSPQTALEQFWAPVFSTPQPVLICLAKPVVYRPTFDLYRKYAQTHPGSFQTEVERSNQVIPLGAHDQIAWSEMMPYPDYGVAVGDVYAAVRVSSLMGQIEKPSQVRIGGNYSFEDLRNSPAVVVGAFNNKWTMQIMPELHFSFVEDNGKYLIREQIPGGRVWRPSFRQPQQAGDDFAIVARLLDSKTGQFTIVAAGVTGSGTQAAGEFISSPTFLERGLSSVSPDWQKKNMELVLQTTVTDSVAGPARVVAAYVW
jgi:hypothetical protein